MKRFPIIMFMLCLMHVPTIAKERVAGITYGTEERPAAGVIVRLLKGKSIIAFTKTDAKGEFAFIRDSVTYPVGLTFISPEYEQKEIEISSTDSLPVRVTLSKKSYTLNEVIVKAPTTRVKGDTITYSVSAFTSPDDRNIEDVIKKLPGITVDDSGTISYEGEVINNFYIEGLNLMGGKYAVATQNISPDDVSSISVYQRHQHKKILKNVVDSKKAALNLKLKKSRLLKPVGYVKGGFGVGDDILWKGNLYGMLISPKNQTIVSANGNNTGNLYSTLRQTSGSGISEGIFTKFPFGTPAMQMSRYMENKSATFTANTLFKLSEESTFTLNSSYTCDKDRFKGSTETQYLTEDGDNLKYAQSTKSDLEYHGVDLRLKYENNSEGHYMLEALKFKGKFDADLFRINHLNSKITQSQRDHVYRIDNNFNYIFKKGHHVFDIKSETSLVNSPVNSMCATDHEADTILVDQTVKGISLKNTESTSISFVLNDFFNVGSSLNFNIDYDKFRSVLLSNTSPKNLNDIEGYRIVTSMSPYVRFRKNHITMTMIFPLSMYDLRYYDVLSRTTNSFHKPFADVILRMFYKFIQSYAEIETGRKHSVGDIANFINNPIHTTFRESRTFGNGKLRTGYSDYIDISVNYRDVPNEFYASVSCRYDKRFSNVMTVSDVSTGGTTSSYMEGKNRRDNMNLMASVTKYFRDIHTTFILTGNNILQKYTTLRNGAAISSKNDMYIVSFKVSTSQLNDFVSANARISYTVSKQDFGGRLQSTSLDDITLNSNLSIFPLKWIEIYGKCFLNRTEISNNNYSSNLFLDCGTRLKFRKFEIELSGRNLTNKRTYSYRIFNDLDYIQYSYDLRPMEWIASLKYSF